MRHPCRGEAMHLLFISSMLPEDEPGSGFEIANRAIADAYRREGVRLSFAGFRRPGSRLPRPNEIPLGTLVPENAGVGAAQKARWLARAFALGLPVSAAKLATMDGDTLGRLIEAAGPVDGFILNSIQMPAAYPFLLQAKPSVFVAHNVEHRSAAENAANARSGFLRRIYEREARLLRNAEAAVTRAAAIVHALSAADLPGLGLAGRETASVLPLATGRITPPDDGLRTHDIGLIGTWSWAPNRVGLDWFLEAVVPLLPPDLTVAIAGAFEGRQPPAPPNVRFLGRVPDARRFMRASHVLALAAKGGTGVQLKTVEAFEEGIPAIATRAALRGVAHLPANVSLADEAPAFAQLLADAVAEARAGRLSRCDGAGFARDQQRGLSDAVREAVADLESLFGRTRGTVRELPGRGSTEPVPAYRTGAALVR